MTKEPKVTHAPWPPIERELSAYEDRAKKWRTISHLLFLLFAFGGVILLFTVNTPDWPRGGYRSFAYGLLALALVPRVVFSIWAYAKSPRCPGCQSSLGWDFRGSPKRAKRVREEHACPTCGIPFIAERE